MNSIYLLIIEFILCLILQIFLYRKYKLIGLYSYIIVMIIISTLMSLKTITLFNYELNLGLIPFTLIFTAYNIIIQKNGPDSYKNILLTTSGAFILSYLILYLVHFMEPSNIRLFTNASYDNIFATSPRIYFANFVTMLYSILINSKLYYYLKKMKNNILISNIFSNIIIQFIASILFGLIAYIFNADFIDIIKIIMIRYLLSLLISIVSTISIYQTKNINE